MNALIIAAGVIVNFILYLSFGSLVFGFKRKDKPVLLSVVVGFFFYYFLFFIFCVPPMKYYRPLSMLTKMWVPFVLAVVVFSAVLNFRNWLKFVKRVINYVKKHIVVSLLFVSFVILSLVLVSATYNFTLDAAYYVANVSTSVETNMMNVYDPFTGAWLDHFEMRYFFATYSIQDAVVCQVTGIPALIWTKSVMASTILLLTYLVYYLISRNLVRGHLKTKRAVTEDDFEAGIYTLLMMVFIFFINVTFNTIYTSSVFLMTRTYEGKAIVGNLAIMTILYLFILMNDGVRDMYLWLMVFIVCFGSATVSSTANMIMPVEVTVLFIPLIIRMRKWKDLFKYVLCVIPGIAFSLTFVLYVKGFFVFYTYPR